MFKLILCSLLTVCVTAESSSYHEFISPEVTSLKKFIDGGILPKLAQQLKEDEAYSIAQCSIDILHWADSLDQLWAWKMVDAAGKFPSGILRGNLQSFGQFDECLGITEEKTGKKFKGKYCPVNLNLTGMALGAASLLPNVTLAGQLPFLSFPMGLCMPDTCNTDEVKELLSNVLDNSNVSFIKSLMSFDESMCSTKDPPNFTVADIVAIIIYIFFAAALVFSTIYDLFGQFKYKIKKKSQTYQALAAFSLYTNTQKLLKVNKSAGTLKCLNGIRAISMMWVMLAHRLNLSSGSGLHNMLDLLDWFKDPWSYFVLGAALAVDTFFFIGGVLLAYVFFSQQKKNPGLNLGLFYFHRFVRLWPAMAATVLFFGTVYYYVGDGPMWPRQQYYREACAISWWSHLIYVQNYVHPAFACGGHLWYLSIDTQLYILSPILLYPLIKWVKWGVVNLVFWILAAQATCITITYLNNWSGVIGVFTGADYFEKFYFATHMRANVWLLGFGFGYLLFRIKNQKIKINKYIVLICWILSLVILCAVVFGSKPLMQLDHTVNQAQDGTYTAFAKTGWSIGLSWLIFACIHGYGGPINWFLSLEILEIVGRLSYSMYLVHVPIQYVFSSSTRIARHFSSFELIYTYFGDVIFAFIFAYIWAMTFESPFLNMERILLHKQITAAVARVENEKKTEVMENIEIAKEKV